MRHLGIDFGSKKVGLAFSDEGGSMAFPHSVVPNDADFFEHLTTLIKTEGVAVIVIGHSQDLSGKDNAIQKGINELMEQLTLHVGIPVHLEPEQFSTKEAERLQGTHDMIDASAAAIILNSYLQKQ